MASITCSAKAVTTKAPVSSLVCFYHLLAMAEQVEAMAGPILRPSCGKCA